MRRVPVDNKQRTARPNDRLPLFNERQIGAEGTGRSGKKRFGRFFYHVLFQHGAAFNHSRKGMAVTRRFTLARAMVSVERMGRIDIDLLLTNWLVNNIV
ncbi:hypothetical protein [Paenibacillus sp. UNC496MF]|uniref:hypothetical protein n=1 Tax=Paenibacillus sp. UNC496MF TaxID=1502753 RepID=UPI001C42E9C4|nr:hypothetical protein [Paenibacillus sp. UNC496MF]